MKSSDPLLLADGHLHCGMYPAGKVAISQHLATPRFPRSDHTISKLTADAGSLCSEESIADLLTSSHPQMSASHFLATETSQDLPFNAENVGHSQPKI